MFCNARIGFPAKWHLRNECSNSILMTCHYPDLGSATDCINLVLVNQKHYQDLGSVVSSDCMSMELLHSFLRCHFIGKLLFVSQNFSCSLRLVPYLWILYFRITCFVECLVTNHSMLRKPATDYMISQVMEQIKKADINVQEVKDT